MKKSFDSNTEFLWVFSQKEGHPEDTATDIMEFDEFCQKLKSNWFAGCITITIEVPVFPEED